MSDYPNSGALFKNDRKESERHPDYKGDAEVDGVQYWISAWIKQGKTKKFMSLSFQPKDSQRSAGEENQVADSNDVPF